MLSFEAARAKVIEVVSAHAAAAAETLDLVSDSPSAFGRVLAKNIIADRNYPPFDRSVRDGYALRSADAPEPGARLRLIGESRAGVGFSGTVEPGQCVRIFTGAPLPRGANTVVMQEYARSEGDSVFFEQAARPGQHLVPAGAEARVGEVMLPRGSRLSYAELAMAAEVGCARLEVYRRPRVAILATGDELVPVSATPGTFQIRDSNNVSLSAQVALAGGAPAVIGTAPDETTKLRAQIEQGLQYDLLILSGGVSAGSYDFVEQVLRELGTEIFFESVAVRPGRPTVFGRCRGKPVFGLPGNPVSTMVTFELFVVPALDLLSGSSPRPLPLFKARLAHPVNEKGGVAHFLPARVTWPAAPAGAEPVAQVEALLWEGSGDIGAVVRANCFLLVHASRLRLEAGEWADVLPRRASF